MSGRIRLSLIMQKIVNLLLVEVFFGCWFDMSSWKFEWGLTFKVREKVQFCISKLFYFPFSQHDNSFSLFLTIQIFSKILEHITIFLCFPFQVSSNFNMITYLTMDWTYRSVKETYGTMDLQVSPSPSLVLIRGQNWGWTRTDHR